MQKYVVLLRGINVGGNKIVPMAQLKKALEKEGYENVKTLLASGNVLLDAKASSPDALTKSLAALLEKTFGFPIPTLVRPFSEVEKLVAKDPFKDIPVTKDTRLYVTFLPEDAKKSTLKIPYASSDGNFRIFLQSDHELCSILTVTPDRGSVDAMEILDKEFGKGITTRNWNTVLKIAKAGETEG